MADYVVQMQADDPSPIHLGDTRSWFYRYKWYDTSDETEVFFPIKEDDLPDIASGDTVWFIMDCVVLGCVPLLRVVEDDFNDTKELWYNLRDRKMAQRHATLALSSPCMRVGAFTLSLLQSALFPVSAVGDTP